MKKIIDTLLHIILDYWWITKKIEKCPYFIRKFYWTRLYYYNRRKYPKGDFLFQDYISYAKNKSEKKPKRTDNIEKSLQKTTYYIRDLEEAMFDFRMEVEKTIETMKEFHFTCEKYKNHENLD